jgi:phosphoadenosine phosphosulfate reductase
MSPATVQTIEETLTEDQLALINTRLNLLTPSEILKWGVEHLPGLHQTTAFGLTGLVGIDMLSKITDTPPPLIFLDTLYHFPETLQLVEVVKTRYEIDVAVYKPDGCETAQDFEAKYGEKAWETSEEVYDYLVKVIFVYSVDEVDADDQTRSSLHNGHTRSLVSNLSSPVVDHLKEQPDRRYNR